MLNVYRPGITQTTVVLVSFILFHHVCWSSQESGSLQEQTRLLHDLVDSSSYDYRVLPPTGNETDDAVEVTVNLMLVHVTSISDYDMDFGVQVLLRQEWTDERLKYADNGKIKYLTLMDTSKVWTPHLFFINEKDGHLHKLTTPNIFYRIFPSGRVLYSTRISLTLWCDMELERFPFDKQRCSMKMASYIYPVKDVRLVWKEESPIQLSKAIRIIGFTLDSLEQSDCTSHKHSNLGDLSCLKVDFLFTRNLKYYILHTFVPSTVLVIVSWASFWIDRDAVSARVILVLSTLFAMSTLSTDIESSVPNIPYVKAMDLWVGTCFTFLLSALVEFAIVSAICPPEYKGSISRVEDGSNPTDATDEKDHIAHPKGKSTVKSKSTVFYQPLLNRLPQDPSCIDSIARVLFPTAFFTFSILYFTYYYLINNNE